MKQSLISKHFGMHLITALVLTLTTGHASQAGDPVYTKDPEHIPRLRERGSPTILLMPSVSPNPFRGLWIVDETCEPFKGGSAPQWEPGSPLPPYKFLVWEVRESSRPIDASQQLTLAGNTLTVKQRYPLNNLLVDDICTLRMDELGNSFVGEDWITHGKGIENILAFYVVSGHLVDSKSFIEKAMPAGFYAHGLFAEIWQVYKNADSIIGKYPSNKYSVKRLSGTKIDSQDYYTPDALAKTLRRQTDKKLLLVEDPFFEIVGDQHQNLEDLHSLLGKLDFQRIIVIEPSGSFYRVIEDVYNQTKP